MKNKRKTILSGTMASTLLGTSITDPASQMFWGSIGYTVGISVISFLIYFISKKVKRRLCEEDIYG